MADPTPQPGEMILYDFIRPPLVAGEYQLRLDTEVEFTDEPVPQQDQPLAGTDYHFNVEGPRFALSPAEVAGVFPPRNGHGPFDSALPHVALGRRTLPWERPLAQTLVEDEHGVPYPFLALVLFHESECETKRNLDLADIVPTAVFQRLGSPAGIRCDAVEADEQLVRGILPMAEELQLLTHVRQVNVDDRELAAGDTDGYFAVVMGNRVPRAGQSYVACLVSVEERTDLLPTTDPAGSAGGVLGDLEVSSAFTTARIGTSILPAEADRLTRFDGDAATFSSFIPPPPDRGVKSVFGDEDDEDDDDPFLARKVEAKIHQSIKVGSTILHPKARLVLLHSWTFACEGDGTFRELMQRVDVGMIGDVDPASKLVVTDTGHIKIDVVDRLGAPEQSWYRGPLVPQPVTRDPLGPYHSADQARRVVPETGAENISYAAAFEVGRLLAAADARLAQELMRWRRGTYREGARRWALELLQTKLKLTAIADPLDPVAVRLAVDVLDKISSGVGPLVDPFDIDAVLGSPLLEPALVADAFGLASVDDAVRMLGIDAALTAPIETVTGFTVLDTLDAVLDDVAGLGALQRVRTRDIDNAATTIRKDLR